MEESRPLICGEEILAFQILGKGSKVTSQSPNTRNPDALEGWAPGHSRGSHQENLREELGTVSPFRDFENRRSQGALQRKSQHRENSMPFWVKVVVTSVVTWSGGSRLSACSRRWNLEKDQWSLSVEGSSRDREAISAWELEDLKTERSADPAEVGVSITTTFLMRSLSIMTLGGIFGITNGYLESLGSLTYGAISFLGGM
jgi:hypothetical protein